MTNKIIDTMWDETPINITQEANFIWSIANKLRGSYMPDKYGDVIIPMTVIRRFECALAKTKKTVTSQYKENPSFPAKALCRLSGFPFYCVSEYDLAELCNDPDAIADNFKAYIEGFSQNVQDILEQLEMKKHIDKMEKDGCLYSVVKAFSELDLSIETFDSIRMGYIFENLIGNAIKYGADGKRVTVRINAEEENDVVEVKVINYGYVIPEKDLPLIFNKFYRVDQSRSTQTGGTGLGLAIAKDIAQMHGGSISVSSDLSGTVFSVRLKIHFDKNAENFVRA